MAFLESYHGNSYFTHLGFINYLEYAQFSIEQVAPIPKWDALNAQASMALFQKMRFTLIKIIIAPLQAAQWLWWKISSFVYPNARISINNSIRIAGAFAFVAK